MVRRLGCAGLLVLAACSSTNEEITLEFPSEAARVPVRSLVATVVVPLIETEDGPPTFVDCERIGTFGPTDAIGVGPRRPDPPRLVDRTLADFPLDGAFSVGFGEPPASDDNPWGLIAVHFEARGEGFVPLTERGRTREDEVALLSGCFCARTQAGRFPELDEDLDRVVRDRCPLLGGQGGEATRRRTVPLQPIASDAFRLESCGAAVGAAPASGRAEPGAEVCVRTTLCADAPAPPCFECGTGCPELDDRSGAPVEFRVVTSPAPVDEPVQVVLTDALGRARPRLDVTDCTDGFDVEARIFGRRDEVVSFRVDCVPALPPLVLLDGGLGFQDRVVAVARVPLPGREGLGVLTQRLDPVSARLTSTLRLLRWEGDRLRAASESATFESRTAHGLVAFPRSDGPDADIAVAAAVATSSLASATRNVEVHTFDWDGADLSPLPGSPLAEPCPQCDCGGLSECSSDATCGPGERCLEERCRTVSTQGCVEDRDCPGSNVDCFDGRCAATPFRGCSVPADCGPDEVCSGRVCAVLEPCRCRLVVAPSDPVLLRPLDQDGDGWTDLALGTPGTPVVTFHRADSSGSFGSGCECAQLNPLLSGFDVLEAGGDDLVSGASPGFDLALISSDAAHLRYGETIDGGVERVTCGTAGLLGEPFEVRDVRAAATRCSTPGCGARDDVLVLGRVDFPSARDEPIVRVVFGESDRITGDQDLFARPAGYVELLASGAPGAVPRDPQSVEVGDFNGDGAVDFAVLFRDLSEVRIWLGSGTGGFTEGGRARYGEEDAACVAAARFAVADLTADGRDEVIVVCDPSVAPRLLVFGVSP